MDGTCSNKSKAWREKKLSWLNVSAPQWSHVVTVGHGSPFDYPSASMHIGKNKRNKPLAAGIAIYTSSCHLFAGHDPDFFFPGQMTKECVAEGTCSPLGMILLF